MFKNKVYSSSIFVFILLIWGCGTMAKNDDTLSVPQKVSIDMPKALKVESSANENDLKFQKEENSRVKSEGYLELKEDVKFLEEERVNLEINLLFINEVIADIDKKCKNVAVEVACTVPDDTLSIIFDENLSSKVKALTSDDFGYVLGDVLTFGDIEFVEHLDTNKYGYSLKIDTTFSDENSTSFTSISWSKEQNLIHAEYNEESVEINSSLKIDFMKKEDGSRAIVVDDGFFNKIDHSSDSFHLNMVKKADEVETYEVNSTSVATDSDATQNRFSSVGKLSNLEGYLNFTGEFDGEIFKEHDTFDGSGNQLSSSYCYSGMDCDLANEESWFTF